MVRGILADARGQMTVEFVVVFPILLIVALVGVNAGLFFSECASFDRLFRQAVVTYAPSPGYGQADAAASVEQALDEQFDGEWLEVSVSSSGGASGLVTYTGRLDFTPTLFARGQLESAFGVEFAPLSHQVQLTVDVYRPGVLI